MSLGHNTDGFDVSAQNITIQNCRVHNQDDCLAVNKAKNISFINNTCVGGHGISIGSVASGAVVDSVLVQNCTISDSQNGVRIKTVYGATSGSVSNITYADIALSNITDMGIVVRQDYLNGTTTGTAVSQMPITGVTLRNVHGTVASGAYSVINRQHYSVSLSNESCGSFRLKLLCVNVCFAGGREKFE
ncbi:Polygalacturonase [Entophlyctis luteolus]|nr:Polygalacturonase [Entophlyctis luteolus]